MDTEQIGQEITFWEILSAGFSLHALLKAQGGLPLQGISEAEFGLLDYLDEIEMLIERFQLERTSSRVSERLHALRVSLIDSHTSILENGMVDQVNLVARDLVQEISREGIERPVFVSMPGRNIQIWDLLTDPIGWFGIEPNAPFQPPNEVVQDFQEAARAFAADFAPAAIVFTLRATEGMLRVFCSNILERPVRRNAQWARLVELLRESGRCPDHILESLDELRQRRNAAMHPGQRVPEEWNDEAAHNILQRCRELIRAMSRHVAQMSE